MVTKLASFVCQRLAPALLGLCFDDLNLPKRFSTANALAEPLPPETVANNKNQHKVTAHINDNHHNRLSTVGPIGKSTSSTLHLVLNTTHPP
mmetsp:Transcript_23689/g.35080  ORF Transcript_23689/g.35080 Transcript_23689/m.35080 type:complete len:92 (+) Transcript_23689:1303-1578(+)